MLWPLAATAMCLSATTSGNKVYFGKSLATVKKATPTKLTVTIPTKCRSGKTYAVRVVSGGQTSNLVDFKVK